MTKKRRFKRWVGIGHFDVAGLVEVARKHGMECIEGFKGSMVFFATIVLYGTKEQMQATEEEWKKKRKTGLRPNEVRSKLPPGAYGCDALIPRAEWAERFIIEREKEATILERQVF